MTVYMLSRRSTELGTLIGKHIKPQNEPKFEVIRFTPEETDRIERNAWQAGSRIGKSAFYVSATAITVNEVIRDRKSAPPYLWFSIPHDQRRKGAAGHLVSNELSFLFFRLYADDLKTIGSAVQAMNSQIKQQVKKQIAHRYSDLLTVLRWIPLPIYEAMVDLASAGKMSSFGFSDLGTDRLNMVEFAGAKVVQVLHYPPVPSPPGFNVVVSKNNGELSFVWAYFDEVLSEDECARMKASFRALLLGVA